MEYLFEIWLLCWERCLDGAEAQGVPPGRMMGRVASVLLRIERAPASSGMESVYVVLLTICGRKERVTSKHLM